MKRRNFLGSILGAGIGFRAIKEGIEFLRFDNPPLVDGFTEFTATPTVEGVQLSVPSNFQYSKLTITKNKFGEPSKVYEKKTVGTSDGTQKFDTKPNGVLAYTIYNSEESEYIAESAPFKHTYSGVKLVEQELMSPNLLDEHERKVYSGQYEIEYSNEFKSISINLSPQKFEQHGRLIGYGGAHIETSDIEFSQHIGNKLIEEFELDTQFEKLFWISRFVQDLEWRSDLDTKGKYEYVRHPVRTIGKTYGDCKDTTILLNSIIESTMDVETGILFSIGHMSTGVKIDSLSDKTMSKIRDEVDISTYKVDSGSYIPIEPTSQYKLGKASNEPVYAIFDGKYRLTDMKGFSEHVAKSIDMIIKGKATI